jgi:hypothetical protein
MKLETNVYAVTDAFAVGKCVLIEKTINRA